MERGLEVTIVQKVRCSRREILICFVVHILFF